MRLFFIRHGETVDNVAGVYAGVRDSELTNHGILQARQLGEYLKKYRCPFSVVFTSPLQRARRTAEAVFDAQSPRQDVVAGATADTIPETPKLVKTALLMEQDFGFYEGKSFFARGGDSRKSGKTAHSELHKQDPDFQDVESAESLAKRGDAFLDEFLVPEINVRVGGDTAIAIVSHGIMLSHLWRRCLLRFSKRSITIAPEVTAAKGQLVLEHLGGWSNTGFLEIQMSHKPQSEVHGPSELPTGLKSGLLANAGGDVPAVDTSRDKFGVMHDGSLESEATVIEQDLAPVTLPVTFTVAPSPTQSLHQYDINILSVNGQEHLRGVKRARGGIGSAKYDQGQQSLDGFFKRAKR